MASRRSVFQPAGQAYQAVLEPKASIELCRAGTRYRDVHLRAEIIAQWLVDESSFSAVPKKRWKPVPTPCFPHGVGHLWDWMCTIGAVGTCQIPTLEKSTQFGLSLRMDWIYNPATW